MRCCLINAHSAFAHLSFCHLKLAAGPPQFAETTIFICQHIMKWQFIEHSAFTFTPICSIVGVLPHSPSEQRCKDSLFCYSSSITSEPPRLSAAHACIMCHCAAFQLTGYFPHCFVSLLMDENDVSLLLMSPLSAQCLTQNNYSTAIGVGG